MHARNAAPGAGGTGGWLSEAERAEFWPELWERYVENKLDYKSPEES